MANGVNIFGRPQGQGQGLFGQQGNAFGGTLGQVLPIGLGFLAGGPLGGIVGSFLSDIFRSNQRNQRAEDLLSQTTGFASDGSVSPNAPPVSIGAQNEDLEGALDPFQSTFIGPGNQVFGPGANDPALSRIGPGSSQAFIDRAMGQFGGPVFNLSDVNPAEAQLGALTELGLTPESVQIGTGFLDDIRRNVSGLFNQARGSVQTDFSDVLAAELLGIGESSRARQQQATNQLAGQASRFGGLEQMLGEASSIANEEAISRAGLAGQAQGRNRLLESQAEQFIANLFGQEAGIMGNFAPIEAGVREGDIARSTAVKNLISSLTGASEGNDLALAQFITGQLNTQAGQALSQEQLENQLTSFFTQIMGPQTQLNDILTTSFLPTLFSDQFTPDAGGGGSPFSFGANLDVLGLLPQGAA